MKKSPRKPLVELRAHTVDERGEALRERVVQVQNATKARAQAEQRERDHDAARRDVEAGEAARVTDGAATAHDFTLLGQYQVGARAAADQLKQQSTAVQQKLNRAEAEQALAEQALVEARAEHRVVEKQQARFEADARAVALAEADEEALEVWGHRRVQG